MNLDFNTRDVEFYLDNAATTIMAEEVAEAMQPFLEERYGNSETPYHLGQEAQSAVEGSRESVARQIGCEPEEIFFTSGGTESNNWAIKGVRLDPIRRNKGCIVTSQIEHASVLESVKNVTRRFPDAYTSSFLNVDGDGLVDMTELSQEMANGDVGLVSIQFGNNEVGTIQPVKEIASICKENGALFHCDACQAFGKVPIDVNELDIDMMSISAHKIHGPMGVGALYVRSGTHLEPFLHGGGHERGMRSGTLNVPAIVGFGVAAELAWSSLKSEMPRIASLAVETGKMLELTVGATVNGSKNRLPHILSLTIPNVDASVVTGVLSGSGICVSTGSACSPKSRSHVLLAMGRSLEQNDGTIRVSLSRYSKRNDVLAFSSSLSAAIRSAQGLEML